MQKLHKPFLLDGAGTSCEEKIRGNAEFFGHAHQQCTAWFPATLLIHTHSAGADSKPVGQLRLTQMPIFPQCGDSRAKDSTTSQNMPCLIEIL